MVIFAIWGWSQAKAKPSILKIRSKIALVELLIILPILTSLNPGIGKLTETNRRFSPFGFFLVFKKNESLLPSLHKDFFQPL
jgi:hypothetical protein